jgi:hypothetical protein
VVDRSRTDERNDSVWLESLRRRRQEVAETPQLGWLAECPPLGAAFEAAPVPGTHGVMRAQPVAILTARGAAPGRSDHHVVQFYHSDDELTEAAANFLAEAIRSGAPRW